MEKDYFDAKFEGIEKLIAAQDKNLTAYIGAVSSGVKDVRAELQAHKESPDAHGAGIVARGKSEWASAVAIVVAVGTLVVDLWRTHK